MKIGPWHPVLSLSLSFSLPPVPLLFRFCPLVSSACPPTSAFSSLHRTCYEFLHVREAWRFCQKSWKERCSLRRGTHINRTGDPFVSLFQRPRADPIEEGQRDNGYGRGTRFPLSDAFKSTWDPTGLFLSLLSDVRDKERDRMKGKEREESQPEMGEWFSCRSQFFPV